MIPITAMTKNPDRHSPTSYCAFARVFTVLSLTICILASAQEKSLPVSGFASGGAVAIGAGDLLHMTVFDTPELSGSLRVSNAGEVWVPLAGSLPVAGLTVDQTQNLIRRRLIDGGFVRDPQVTVFVVEYATQGVSVLGEVKKPGIYPVHGAHRLLDYISLAEGLTPMGSTAVTITHRGEPEKPQRVKLTTETAPGLPDNPEVLPGDTIFVAKTGIVYVVGDVGRPGGFPLNHDEQLTVLQALALAEGANRTAAESSARLIRRSPQGRQEIPVNLKKIASAKNTDLAMQDEDILFVPCSLSKSAFKRGLEAAAQAAVGVTIYRR
jgi:polysaccharide biosynthesis/export protein